jgi:hypothetical protein
VIIDKKLGIDVAVYQITSIEEQNPDNESVTGEKRTRSQLKKI